MGSDRRLVSRRFPRSLSGLVMLVGALTAFQTGTPAAQTQPSGSAMNSAEILQRAEDLAGAEKYREAVYYYRRYLQDDASNPEAVVGLALCIDALEGPEAARPHFLRTLELAPGNSRARNWLNEHRPKVERTQPRAAPTTRPAEPAVRSEAVGSGAQSGQNPPPPVPAAEISQGEQEEQTEQSVTAEPASSTAATTEGGTAEGPADEAVEGDVVPPTEGAADFSPVGFLLLGGLAAVVLGGIGLAVLLTWRRRAACSMRGRIEKFPLADLLQWLAIGSKEGRVRIRSNAGAGQILVKDGRVRRADFGSTSGTDAVYEILSLERGRFVFCEEALPESAGLNLDVPAPQILMRWACAVDEAKRDSVVDEGGPGGPADPAVDLETVDDSDLNVDLPF